MDHTAATDLTQLAAQLTAALRRDAAAPGAAANTDLDALAALLDRLLGAVAADPSDGAKRRALLLALSEVEAFRERLRAAHVDVRAALLDAAGHRTARRAYGDAQRYAEAGVGA